MMQLNLNNSDLDQLNFLLIPRHFLWSFSRVNKLSWIPEGRYNVSSSIKELKSGFQNIYLVFIWNNALKAHSIEEL